MDFQKVAALHVLAVNFRQPAFRSTVLQSTPQAHDRQGESECSSVLLPAPLHLYTVTQNTFYLYLQNYFEKAAPWSRARIFFWGVTLHVFFLRFFLTLFLFEEVVFFLAFWLWHQPFTKAAQDSCPGPLKTAVESKNKSHKSLVLWGLQKCQNTNPWGKGAVISVLTFFQRVPGSPDGCLSELKPPPQKKEQPVFRLRTSHTQQQYASDFFFDGIFLKWFRMGQKKI